MVKPKLPENADVGDIWFLQYANDPVAYVQDVVLARRPDKAKILPHQADILEAVATYDRVAVKAANGMGKDAVTAWLIEWFLLTHPYSKVPCTSGVSRQVKDVLFSEIHKWTSFSMAAKWVRLMDMALRVKGNEKDWFALGFTAESGLEGEAESKAEGFHAAHMLYVLTEARAVPSYVWRAAKKASTGSNNKIFAQSVTGIDSPELSDFCKVFTRLRDSWKTFSFPAAVKDSQGGYKPTCELITQTSIDEKLAEGEDSAIFQSGVLANFVKQSNDGNGYVLFPLEWIEAHVSHEPVEVEEGEPIFYGVDVARGGEDETVIVKRSGNKIVSIEAERNNDTMLTCGRIKHFYDSDKGKVYVDVIGVGSGVFDRLREQSVEAVGINVGNAPNDKERFAGLRDELYWNFRELLNPANSKGVYQKVRIPDDPELIQQLATMRYKHLSNGKVKVESKDDMKKRGLKSPDRADAVCLAFTKRLSKTEQVEERKPYVAPQPKLKIPDRKPMHLNVYGQDYHGVKVDSVTGIPL